MKTTSYKISKQLAEVGFNKYKIPATEYCWHHDNFGSTRFLIGAELEDETTETLAREHKIYPAYDLETILEALPKFIVSDQRLISPAFIAYGQHEEEFLSCDKQENESFADVAARLLLLLNEKSS